MTIRTRFTVERTMPGVMRCTLRFAITRFMIMLTFAALPMLSAGGCSSGAVKAENDRVRAQVLDLEDANEALEANNAELRAKLNAAAGHAPGRAVDEASSPISDEARQAIPRITTIAISRLSHLADENGDGSPDRLRIYITSADGRGRFTQMVGTLSVHAALLPMDTDAITYVRSTLNPIALRDSYRSGITGTHYTIEFPIAQLPADGALEVRAVFVDALTGVEHEAIRTVEALGEI